MTGVWLVQNPETTRGNATVAGYVHILFGGLGMLVFLAVTANCGVMRRPRLDLTASEWRAHPRMPQLPSQAQTLDWQDMACIGMWRLRLSRFHMQYYLAVFARESAHLPRPRPGVPERLRLRAHPAGLWVELNPVFLRPASAKCDALLKRIDAVCANELHRYEVQLTPEVQPL